MATIKEWEAKAQYNEWLNEIYPVVTLGYGEFLPSDIIRELDPIMYEAGFTDDYLPTLAEDGTYVEGYEDMVGEPNE